MKTVAIIGGSQTGTFKEIGKRHGLIIEHHDGKIGGGRAESHFKHIINKAEVIIILKGAINHSSMWTVRGMVEKQGKKIDYHNGFGVTGAVEKALQLIS